MCVTRVIEIQSDEGIPIDENFKVSAGPGAGKTHWLVLHIKNILRNSNKLGKTARIACITYTNTGVDEIRGRLGNSIEGVEVSTIHSFLYKNVVRPFGFLLIDNENRPIINLKELDGHDEHIPSRDVIRRWKENTGQQYLQDDKKIYNCLIDLDWKFDDADQLSLHPRKPWLNRIHNNRSIRNDSYISYKKLYWDRGQIHHEDVLYFAYRLIKENPRVLSFIRAKFPYIFIDEFQDTHPIQTAIIKKIAQEGTVTGVIGDAAQSIYKFQGASRQDFVEFSLPDIKNYVIRGNRRSTSKIVNFLNTLRGDEIEQVCLRDVEGDQVSLIVGDMLDAVDFILGNDDTTTILAWRNATVNQIRHRAIENTDDLWVKSRISDSDYQRQDLIYNTLSAMEFLSKGNLPEARKRVTKIIKKYTDGTAIPTNKKREYAIRLLHYLVTNQQAHFEQTITTFNNHLLDYISNEFNVKVSAKITRGNYRRDFSDRFTYKDLAQQLKSREATERVRTIHQAKGAQFRSVLVILDQTEDINHLINPDLESNDDQARIYYVALSRAQDTLFISIPAITEDHRRTIEGLGVTLYEI